MEMTVEEWSLVKSAFDAALNQPEPVRRDYLAAAYGDRPEILSYVLNLLENYREDTDWTTSLPANNHSPVFQPGEVVAGRFRIVRMLGIGGMGQVFLAYDQKLKESIALKTLHPILADDPEFVQRFHREIRVARTVSHPNLCRIYDLVEHSDGASIVNCFAMEHLKGESLADLIARSRPLGTRDALALLRPIASALAALHDSGILHRDLKPSNVILDERTTGEPRVVLTDFGLAKPTVGGSALFESLDAGRAGSPYFMAPELWDDNRPTVASDVYSLGLILDEMVTRSPAFSTASLVSFYHSKFHAGPIEPGLRSNDLPAHWQNAIRRCVATDPRDRYQSSIELISDLEKIPAPQGEVLARSSVVSSVQRGGRISGPSVHTIAVMPFSDRGPDKCRAFCDGFAEELIHLLSQIPCVRVVARASVFELRKAKMSVQEIGRTLHASHLICGSVSKSGDRLCVGVQLVHAAEGYNVWSHQFDEQMTDVFVIHKEIAKKTIDLLKGELDASIQIFEIKPPTANIDSYHLYLQGLFEFNQHTSASLERAITLFERAIDTDRDFALAYGGLADSYCTQEWYGARPADLVMPRAKESASQAIKINSSLANVHCTLGRICARYEWDWESAGREFSQALALGRGMVRPYFSYALDYLTPVGLLDDAVEYVRMALDFDPLSPILHAALGGCLYRLHSYDLSERSLRNALKMNPDFYHLHWSLARTLEQVGRYDEAVTEYESAIRANQDNRLIYAELGHCYGTMGKHENAEAVLKDLLAVKANEYISPLCLAFAHLGLTHVEESLDAIDAAAKGRVGTLIWLSIDPRFDVLRGEKRFQGVQTSMRTSAANPAVRVGERGLS
jgi:serine/threonine protein kinase/tetratricopeptide (TPR) repeat protein